MGLNTKKCVVFPKYKTDMKDTMLYQRQLLELEKRLETQTDSSVATDDTNTVP